MEAGSCDGAEEHRVKKGNLVCLQRNVGKQWRELSEWEFGCRKRLKCVKKGRKVQGIMEWQMQVIRGME